MADLMELRVQRVEDDITDIQEALEKHSDKLNSHDIIFTEHTKDFESMCKMLDKLERTMQDFIKELQELRQEPLETSKYYRQLVVGTIVTTVIGVVLGIVFGSL